MFELPVAARQGLLQPHPGCGTEGGGAWEARLSCVHHFLWASLPWALPLLKCHLLMNAMILISLLFSGFSVWWTVLFYPVIKISLFPVCHLPLMEMKCWFLDLFSWSFSTSVPVLVSLGCYHDDQKLGGLNNQHLSLTVLEAGKFKISMPGDSVLGGSLLPCVLRAF